MKKFLIVLGIVIVLVIVWFGSTYNSLVTKQETVGQKWGQVQATYQRRLDLIPNLVSTVKGYAKHEKSTLVAVTQARAKAYQSSGRNALSSKKAFQQYAAGQAAVGSALGRLMLVVERYPNLKASQNFLTLQSQLEGTENRINVARQRFNDVVKIYNSSVRRFPGNIVARIAGGFELKPFFQADAAAAHAPKVTF